MATIRLYSNVLSQFEELNMGEHSSDDLATLQRVADYWAADPAHRVEWLVPSERVAVDLTAADETRYMEAHDAADA
jgi:hypothetical protein